MTVSRLPFVSCMGRDRERSLGKLVVRIRSSRKPSRLASCRLASCRRTRFSNHLEWGRQGL